MRLSRTLTRCSALHGEDHPSDEDLSEDQRALVRDINAHQESGVIALEDRPCLCGGETFSLVAAYDRYRIRLQSVICDSCGLMQSNPYMTPEATDNFYRSDMYRRLYDPQMMVLDRPGFDRQVEKVRYRYEIVRDVLAERRIGRVLEFGCGGGWNLYPYHQAGAVTVGYDQGPTLVRLGRGLGMDLREGGVDDIDESGFDLIVLSHVVEHFLDPVGMVARLVRRVAPGGHVYMEVPDAESFAIGSLQNAHPYLFSQATLTAYMAKAGLGLVDARRVGPHLAAVFRPSSAPVETDLTREYATRVKSLRAYDRRQRLKSGLAAVGLLSVVQGLRGVAGRGAGA